MYVKSIRAKKEASDVYDQMDEWDNEAKAIT